MSAYDVPFDEPEIGDLERLLLLRSFFAGEEAEGADWEWLSRNVEERRFKKGELLRWNGIDRLHLLIRGSVAIVRDGQVQRRFGQGEMVGMVDALMGRPHDYDLLVVEETVALEVLYEDWLDFVEDHFELARRGILKLAAELLPRSHVRTEDEPTASIAANRAVLRRSRLSTSGLEGRISAAERLAVLRASPPLARATLQALARLARYSEAVELSPGERFVATPHALYVVESGRLESAATAHALEWRETVEASGALGGLALLQAGPYEVTATALEPTLLFRIPTERMLDVMEDDFSLTYSLLAFIAAEMEMAVANRGGAPMPLERVREAPLVND